MNKESHEEAKLHAVKQLFLLSTENLWLSEIESIKYLKIQMEVLSDVPWVPRMFLRQAFLTV
jgi:hypothetical protein